MIDRHVGFMRALREAGLPVSLAEGLDAANALTVIDLAGRETLREAYAATVVKRPSHGPGSDVLFDLWSPAVISQPYGGVEPPDDVAERPGGVAGELPQLRDRLAELL